MSDEGMTKPAKIRGRRKTFTNAEAAMAYDLYVVKNLPGDKVAKALGKPRTTVIGMAREHEAKLLAESEAQEISDRELPAERAG